jgi:urease accessory protein
MTMAMAHAFAGRDRPADAVLELPFELRERSRFRATLLGGEDIGVDLPVGTLIRHADRLLLSDGRVVAVEAAPEALLEVHAHDAPALARIAYHIGNRHVPLQVGNGFLRLLPDHVLQAMIEGLGGHVHRVSAGFQPESGAYGHSHVHHQHDDQGHGGRIHIFDARHAGHDHGHAQGHGHDHSHDCDHGHGHGHDHTARKG